MNNSCNYKNIDIEKHKWDTAAKEVTPVIARLPSEGEVYTYTPIGGRAVDTPSLPVPVRTDVPSLTVPGMPDIPLEPAVTDSGTDGTNGTNGSIKMGDFERLD